MKIDEIGDDESQAGRKRGKFPDPILIANPHVRGRSILGTKGRDHFGIGGDIPRNLQPIPIASKEAPYKDKNTDLYAHPPILPI
jgi:hypothetical protein